MAKVDKLLEQVKEHFDDDEYVLATVYGAYETKILGSDSVRNGILVATDQRVVFFAKKLTGYEFESFPYNKISSMEMGKNWMGHTIKFFASGNDVKMKWINTGNVEEFVGAVKTRMEMAETAHKSSPAPTVDPVAQLERLGKLYEAGVLTDAEFTSKKAEILARI